MTIDEAIKELKDASDSEIRYGDTDHHYDEVMKRVEAFEMAIRALDQISHLKDRPCEVCEFYTGDGCSKWECVFEGSDNERHTKLKNVAVGLIIRTKPTKS
jgi:hypothetical protein